MSNFFEVNRNECGKIFERGKVTYSLLEIITNFYHHYG